jgi:ATP-dependent helicase HrpB
MLLDAGLAGERKVVVLQPRRVAARTVAARVAWERHVALGQEVGYQIRFDDQTSLGTRICYVTEGILLRWLQADRTLPDVGIILFDEFHERNLLSDVALALLKQVQETSRPDLKLIVMSATLEAESVAAYLSGGDASARCPIVLSEGRAFGVEVEYLTHPDSRPITEQAADAVEQILRSGEPGDILVFMPGMAEINATIGALGAMRVHERFAPIPLHGELPPEDQDRAFVPSPLRKIVVATNVAETSVTIDGIRHVVDGGLARVARYDPERGISTLFLEEISRASADQRKGRAGRTAPGTCHRLWTESGHLNRPERNTPEIQRSDLAEVVLLLHSLGIRKAGAFAWLDRPDPQAVERAETLLHILGAIDPGTEHLTPIGRRMLRLPMHPRYSRMLVEAGERGCVPAAALCAALVSGRDLLMRLGRDDQHIAEARELFEASQESDFYRLMLAYQFARQRNFSVEACRRYGVHAQTARQVEQTFGQILQIAQQQGFIKDEESVTEHSTAAPSPAGSIAHRTSHIANAQSDPLLPCLMAGFIDQLCIRRDRGTLECDLTEGRHGTLMRESVVQEALLFVAASIREVESRSGKLTLLGLATAVKPEWIETMFPQDLSIRVEHLYDRTQKRVAAVKLVRFLDLVIHHEHQREVDPTESGLALAEAFTRGWFELPLFNHEVKQFVARVQLVNAASPELGFPAFTPDAVRDCLARAFAGLTLTKEAQATHLRDAFWKHLPQGQIDWLNELAPVQIPWPDGRQLKLLYAEATADAPAQVRPPELQVKLHECFCVKEHPTICGGKVPVKLWLCGPDGKRLEPTMDWPSFRAGQYPKLKPSLQKRYPGVAWV